MSIVNDELRAEIGIKENLDAAVASIERVNKFIEKLREKIQSHAKELFLICESSRNYAEIESAIINFVRVMDLLKKKAPLKYIGNSIDNFIGKLREIQARLVEKIRTDVETGGVYTNRERVAEALREIIKATNETIIKDLGKEFEHVRGLELALVKMAK